MVWIFRRHARTARVQVFAAWLEPKQKASPVMNGEAFAVLTVARGRENLPAPDYLQA